MKSLPIALAHPKIKNKRHFSVLFNITEQVAFLLDKIVWIDVSQESKPGD